jgi:hypothetical protein
MRPYNIIFRKRSIVTVVPSFASAPSGAVRDMSLVKNQAGQNFTFALVNAASGSALTGATIVGFVSKDGGGQASIAGTITELGHGMYNYIPTQAETNGNELGFLLTGTAGAFASVPFNLMFLTLGFHKNVAGQHVTFAMISTSGTVDPSASITTYVSIDGGAQSIGAGTITNLGNGQYDYQPTQAETNGNEVTYLFVSPGDMVFNICIFTVP